MCPCLSDSVEQVEPGLKPHRTGGITILPGFGCADWNTIRNQR